MATIDEILRMMAQAGNTFGYGGAVNLATQLAQQAQAGQRGQAAPAWLQAQQDGRMYGGGGGRGAPSASFLQGGQDQRRYAGAPLSQPGGAGGGSYESFITNAMIAQYGPQLGSQMARAQLSQRAQGGPIGGQMLGPVNAPPGAAPVDWTQQAPWQWSNGRNPLANVPPDEWEAALAVMGAALPYAQMDQYRARDQWQQGFDQRQADQAAQQWAAQFGAGRQDQGFQNWLASQRLALDQGQAGLGQQQFQADNAWRNRQLDMQQVMQNFQMGPQWQQQVQQMGIDNAFRQGQADIAQGNWLQQFGANRDDAMWNRDWQNRNLTEDTRRYDQNFAAGRDDVMWNRGFADRQFGEDTRRFDLTNAQQEAMNQFTRAMQTSQFDWTKQRAGEQDALQRELQAMSTFGRRFGPAVGSM